MAIVEWAEPKDAQGRTDDPPGWVRDPQHISHYPDVAGLARDVNCYWLSASQQDQTWWHELTGSQNTETEAERAAAHLILSRKAWTDLSGSVEIKKLHVAPGLDTVEMGGRLLDLLCAWADRYSWQLDLTQSALALNADDAQLAILATELLASRGFSPTEEPASGEIQWRRTAVGADQG